MATMPSASGVSAENSDLAFQAHCRAESMAGGGNGIHLVKKAIHLIFEFS